MMMIPFLSVRLTIIAQSPQFPVRCPLHCIPGDSSCLQMTVSVENSTTMNVDCLGITSCKWTQWSINHVMNTSILCEYTSNNAADHSCLWTTFEFNHSSFINIATAGQYNSDLSVSDAVRVDFKCYGRYAIRYGELRFENAGDIKVLSSVDRCLHLTEWIVITTNGTSDDTQVDLQCIGSQSCRSMSLDAGESNSR